MRWALFPQRPQCTFWRSCTGFVARICAAYSVTGAPQAPSECQAMTLPTPAPPPQYGRPKPLLSDTVAGLCVAGLLLPEAVAYAQLFWSVADSSACASAAIQ